LLRDSEGAPLHFVISSVDITERKRKERDLETSEARYRRLFETAKDGILIVDADDGKIVEVNPFLIELTGYSRQDFLGKRLWEIALFKDAAMLSDLFDSLQTRRHVSYESLLLETRDGQRVDVEFVSHVYPVEGKNLIQCNIRDISAKQQVADELRFNNLVLLTQQETSIDGILVADADGRLVSSNRRFADMWNIPRNVMASNSVHTVMQSILDRVMDPEEFEYKIKCLLATHEKSQDEIALKDGRTFDRYSAPMLDADGKHFGRVWYFRDITVHRRVEEERERLKEQLGSSQKLEAIGILAGGVAHDFNNLLSVILLYNEFAMDGTADDVPLKNDLIEIKIAAERAVALTQQLLAFSRKQVLQPVPLDLNGIAAGVQNMLQRIVGEDIDLVLVLAPDLGLTLADPTKIEQVLMNLVVNARDAMPGGGEITIETSNVELDEHYAARHSAAKAGAYVQLVVTDTGHGMDEQTLARVFEPFYTTKEKGHGTGLGLATVYGIVKQTGGNILVQSERGAGTSFKIHLPMELSSSVAMTIRPASVHARVAGAETILLVEDDDALRKAARRTLVAAGYTVLTAVDGNDALLISAQHLGVIHLLLTDVVMPRMGGKALAEELLKSRPIVKVLYMSGYTDNTIDQHGVLPAGTHFIGKPFATADLTRKVREVIDRA
jgi:PAS domain S-box-containing protein